MKWRFLFLGFAFAVNGNSQTVISGRIINKISNEAVASASVYVNNTTLGSVTDDKGSFFIPVPFTGRLTLIATSVGYETFQTVLDLKDNQVLKIYLIPKTDVLPVFQIKPPDPDGWQNWGKFFTDAFIGTGPLSSDCKIVNPEVLKFVYYKDAGTLMVYSNKPVVVLNHALGYEIHYSLENFEYNFSEKQVVYYGFALFKDLAKPGHKRTARWQSRRAETYRGSLLHFMRSFFTNRLQQEGFELRNLSLVINENKLKAKDVFSKHKDSLLTGIKENNYQFNAGSIIHEENYRDSSAFYKKFLLQPDSVISRQLVIADSVGFVADSSTAGFYSKDSLEADYLLQTPPGSYIRLGGYKNKDSCLRSQFKFVNDKPVYILSNGYYYSPVDLKTTGYWAWSETLCTLLPYNYSPAH